MDMPFSFQEINKFPIQQFKLKGLDLNKVYKEDSIDFVLHQQFNVARFQKISINSKVQAKWNTLADGKKVWRIELKSEGAEQLAIKFSNIELPKGSKLFLYSKKEKSEFWVFDAKETKFSKNTFVSKFVQGDQIILEYNQFSNFVEDKKPVIDFEGLINYYVPEERRTPGFAQSTDCEVNVACSEGVDWCREIASVVRIFIQSGTHYSYCSGAIVNNSKQDFTPYILTAEHCGEASSAEDFKYWRFDFNYQSNDCSSPPKESEIFTHHISGCQQIAKAARIGNVGSDFRLVKLLDSIPKAWNVYYSGWDIKEYSVIKQGGVGIHHPYGDIKKISTYTQDLSSSDAFGDNENDDFWKTFWIETENAHGITEAGSSGSPLFNNKGLLIGTLATGSSYCDNINEDSPDYYGKISRHWDNNGTDATSQLKPWLDPINSGVQQLGGLAGNSTLNCGDKLHFDKFLIYPNPANDVINIANNDLSVLSDATIQIFNTKGSLVLTENTNGNIAVKSIRINHLPSDIYVLEVRKSNWIIQQKFVILR